MKHRRMNKYMLENISNDIADKHGVKNFNVFQVPRFGGIE